MIGMELIPLLEIGWFNGWILLCLYFLIYSIILLAFPKNKKESLFYYNKSRWNKKVISQTCPSGYITADKRLRYTLLKLPKAT